MNTNLKYCVAVFFSYIAFIYFTGIYYNDDLMRSTYGYFTWSGDGRPFADLFYHIFYMFGVSRIPDSFPAPIIATGLFFCAIFYQAIQNTVTISPVKCAIILFIFMGNPYLISNLLFRYDSPFMVLSMAFAFAPFACIKLKPLQRHIISVFCLVFSFGLYQAAVNIFIGFSAIYAFSVYMKGRSSRSYISTLSQMAGYLVVAYIIYSQIVLRVTNISDYFRNFTRPIHLNHDGILSLIANLKKSLSIIESALSSGIYFPVILFMIAVLVCLSMVLCRDRNKFLPIAFFISSVAVAFSSVGMSIFSADPALFSRTFMGFGVFLIYFPLLLSILNANKNVSTVLTAILSISLLSIFFAGINAFKEEDRYQSEIANRIISDLNHSEAVNYTKIAIINNIKPSPLAAVNMSEYPVLKLTAPMNMSNMYDGARMTLLRNGFHDVFYVAPQELDLINSKIPNLNPIASNNLYDILSYKETIVLVFK
ncbi:glucosyltransferase domain-containing protein [Citrobacter freundii]|nr:glucosyltransferase domain-containing protein [Citrobacter freundii]HEC5315511.1 glucosyltransferase domain-containing protein [Citrobacter freundii]